MNKKMKIIGYSERGAMNALFYGMAHANDEKAMNEFIRLAGIGKTKGDDNEGPFSDFEIYSEFSLSDFGDPDMIVTAKDCNNKDVVFFIEAKASCGMGYNLSTQKDFHEDYMSGSDIHKDGHSSNLFFQLRLKNYFIQRLVEGSLAEKTEETDNSLDRLRKSRNRYRKIGKNVVVNKLVKDVLEKCEDNAYYIAIIPEQDDAIELLQAYDLDIHLITWEKIYGTNGTESIFNKYVKPTIDFNQNKENTVSQILNHPVQIKHI